jgi:hypothetical protein
MSKIAACYELGDLFMLGASHRCNRLSATMYRFSLASDSLLLFLRSFGEGGVYFGILLAAGRKALSK